MFSKIMLPAVENLIFSALKTIEFNFLKVKQISK